MTADVTRPTSGSGLVIDQHASSTPGRTATRPVRPSAIKRRRRRAKSNIQPPPPGEQYERDRPAAPWSRCPVRQPSCADELAMHGIPTTKIPRYSQRLSVVIWTVITNPNPNPILTAQLSPGNFAVKVFDCRDIVPFRPGTIFD